MGAIRRRCAVPVLAIVAWLAPGLRAGPDPSMPGDDATFRPTVMIHKGAALGTGTVIASVDNQTLILTASHVLEDPGALTVDLNRFNLGLERFGGQGQYPKKLNATIVARDTASDLAVVLVRGQLALPYVARIARGEAPPAPGAPVTSIGFDQGQKLIGMNTRVRSIEVLDLGKGGGNRPFIVTETPPEHGRSGGGLFRPDGALVGVCLARAEFEKGPTQGVFSTLGNVRKILRSNDKLAEAVQRSDARPRSPAR